MQKLKEKLESNTSDFNKQLDSRVQTMDSEREQLVGNLRLEHENELKNANLVQQKKISHLR